ncbi:hypothetical protein FE257_003624 [Aspergillus nanangensis]|uniref:FAD-binding PCMH-type domain-containing protein n=1 Tax=Aspergillus nanangensis TaxID=2582783 RepID=A0AAD4GXI7_ASPNN|nr:hypothetical protein FE257_003624 [Aspergillus nanangensis]
MRVASTLLPLVGVALADASSVSPGCTALQAHQHLGDSVFPRNSTVYQYESQEFWSNTEIMSPGCVFRPQSSRQLAAGLRSLVHANAPFAVRGGGHMGIRGSNNIDHGVLVVMSNLTTLELSEDHSLLSLGPAYRWQDVYVYLEKYGLSVAGGRLGPVGVPGLLLAGGVNFYGNQVGWGCDTVVNYEVVLADGSVVQANKHQHQDLFWALKGGSSNFGIVTRFDLETIQSPKVWAGAHTVEAKYVDQFLAATAKYASDIYDPKTHIVPAVVPGDELLASVILFYDSPNASYPDIFKPFTDIPAVSSTLGFKTVAEFAAETGAMVVPDIGDVFVAGTVVGITYDELFKGIQLINTTFFAELPKLYAQIPAANISTIQLDWQPIGADWIAASAAKGGNALGLDPTKVYLCYAEVVEWIGSAYDGIVAQWVEETTYKINNATQKAGLYDPFNYMGDSAGFQSIFPGYGQLNHQLLQTVARKYDPTGVFQALMPGGFKSRLFLRLYPATLSASAVDRRCSLELRCSKSRFIRSPQETSSPFDYVVCVHKAIDNEGAVANLSSAIGETTTIVLIQNGVGNEEPFREAFPQSSIISCVAWVGATQTRPGVVQHSPAENTELGLFPNAALAADEEQRRLRTFASLLHQGETNVSVVDDIQRPKWEKVVWNCAWNAVTALTLVDTHAWLSSSPDAEPWTRRLMREVIAAGQACGVSLQDELVEQLMDRIHSLPPIQTSMQMDHVHGRQMEIEVILGYPLRVAREHGVQTPLLETIYLLLRAVNGRLG